MDVLIRNFNFNDYDSIDKLIAQVHSLHVNNRPDIYKPLKHVYSEEDFLNMVNNSNIIGLIAEASGIPAGCCIVALIGPSERQKDVSRKTAYMDALCVDVNYRKKGIGKLLCERAEQSAKERGAIALELTVWSFNENAIEFYKSAGMNPQRIIMEKQF